MHSWADCKRLLALGDARLAACERALGGKRRRLGALEEELRDVDGQISGVRALLAESQLRHTALSLQGLRGHLRQQAVMRRQLQLAVLERARVEHGRAELQAAVAQQQQGHVALSRKQQCYQQIAARAAAQRRVARLLQEERESEDRPRRLR
jgi:hypothetical protein